MKKIEINNLPAGSIILVKKYNLWQRLKAKLTKKSLAYNDAWLDPTGNNIFEFKDTLWIKHNINTFVPKKGYSRKEQLRLFEEVLLPALTNDDPAEIILLINLIRPNTFSGHSLEELLDDNKYYTKTEVK